MSVNSSILIARQLAISDLLEIKEAKKMTWEQVSHALYQILDDMDTASDVCKENLQAYQDMILKLQAKKNQFLRSPDGYCLEPVVGIVEDEKNLDISEEDVVNNKDELPLTKYNITESKIKETGEMEWKSYWVTSSGEWLKGDTEISQGDHFGFLYAGENYAEKLGITDPEMIAQAKELANLDPKTDEDWDRFADLQQVIYGDFANEVLENNARVGLLQDELYIQTYSNKGQMILEKVQEHQKEFSNVTRVTWEDKSGFYHIPADEFWAMNKYSEMRGFKRECKEAHIPYKRGGFILPDGRNEEIRNYQMGDHDNYALKAIEKETQYGWAGSPSAAFDEFLKEGNIRWLINEVRSELNVMFSEIPTETQIRALHKLAKGLDNFFFEYVPETEPEDWEKENLEGTSWEEFMDLVREARVEEAGEWKKKLATAGAAGLIGAASALGGFPKVSPVDMDTIEYTASQEESPAKINMSKIATIESSNNPKAENERTGARGLCQIMKPTWEEMVGKMGEDWSWDEAFDADKNLAVATYYMNTEIPRLLKHFELEDNVEHRLAAYNWGIGNLKKLGLEKAPQETKDYIQKYHAVADVDEARGWWRNWDTVECTKCPWRDYRKNFAKRGEKVPDKCSECGAEVKLEEFKINEAALDIKVPKSAWGHFWEEVPEGHTHEFWALRGKPKVIEGDKINFYYNGDLVAEAAVDKIEAPGESSCAQTGRFENKWKIFWRAEDFVDLRESKINESDDPDTIEIPLSNSDLKAIIDKEDYDKVKGYTWRLLKDKRTKVWYVATSKREGKRVRTIRLHRLIMNADPEYDVHHKEHNPLDNRKSMLQLIPRTEHTGHGRRATFAHVKYPEMGESKTNETKGYVVTAEHQDQTSDLLGTYPANAKLEAVMRAMVDDVLNKPYSDESREGDEIIITTPEGKVYGGPLMIGDIPHWIGEEGVDVHDEGKCVCPKDVEVKEIPVEESKIRISLTKLHEGLVDHAKTELQIAGLFDKDSDYEGMLGEAVMELIETFAEQGHSGFSAVTTADIFNKLASWKPLTELTDNPDEWQAVKEYYGGPEEDLKGMEFQSRRDPSCFSSDRGKTYYSVDEMHEDVVEDGEVVAFRIDQDKKVIHKSKPYKG